MAHITKADIYYLFDELWPEMIYASEYRVSCLDQFSAIDNYFRRYPEPEHNELLQGLCSLDKIGITIATGLIHSAHRETRVPFDKWTMGYALKEDILKSDRISTRYVRCCERIKDYCDGYTIEEDGREVPYRIIHFVREAADRLNEELTIKPK